MAKGVANVRARIGLIEIILYPVPMWEISNKRCPELECSTNKSALGTVWTWFLTTSTGTSMVNRPFESVAVLILIVSPNLICILENEIGSVIYFTSP